MFDDDAMEFVITETAVGELAGVRVGVHSVWEETWTDERGISRNSPRATLSVMGPPPDDFDVRVHEGSEIHFQGRYFRVTAIKAPIDAHGVVTLLEVVG